MSRKHAHAYATFQRGKGLVGFLAGLVLATMIIIAVLLMLNSNSKRGFVNNPPTNTTKPVETLSPNGASGTALNDENTITDKDRQASGVQVIGGASVAQPPVLATSEVTVEPIVDNTNNGIEHQPIQEEPIIQPRDDRTTDEPTGETPIDEEPAVMAPPAPPRPPKTQSNVNNGGVNPKTGVPNGVRPSQSGSSVKQPSTSGSGSSNATQTRPPRTTTPSHNTGTLKKDDLNIAGVDSPRQSNTSVKPTPPKTTTPPTTPSSKPPVAGNNTSNAGTTPSKTTTTTTKPAAEPTKTPAVKPVETTKPVVKDTPKPTTSTKPKPADVKPTPQQILDSGNIEKARELARRQATNKSANTNTSTPTKARAVVIQAGSYGSRNAAESQRARLALLGVQARIVEANVNGKPTFRVQTNRLEGNQAQNARSVLQRNGVSTLERSAD